MNTQMTLGNNKYMVVSDSISHPNHPYLGLDKDDWNGPCVHCGGNSFSITYPARERKYQHFCSGGCAMCFDSRKTQSEKARNACSDYITMYNSN